jgi:hypothetical protein
MPDDVYLILSHEHASWWGPGHCGHVRTIAEAGRYTYEEAMRVCRSAISGTTAELRTLPELPVRLADLMAMARSCRVALTSMATGDASDG